MITMKPADKGGKVVVMNQTDYISECKKDLSDECFYRKLENDPNVSYATEVDQQAKNLLDNAMISEEVPPRIRMKASRRAAMSAAGARSGKSRSDTMEAAEMLVGAPF